MIHILWVFPGFNAKGVCATPLLGWALSNHNRGILHIAYIAYFAIYRNRNEKNAVAQGGFGSLVPWGYSMKLLGSPPRGLIVNSGMHGPDHRKWLIQTVFWSIAAKVALPYLDQDQTMFCPATTPVRQIWESFWDQCIIGSHHLLCSDPEKASRGREAAKKSSCNKHPSEG